MKVIMVFRHLMGFLEYRDVNKGQWVGGEGGGEGYLVSYLCLWLQINQISYNFIIIHEANYKMYVSSIFYEHAFLWEINR